MAQQLSALLQVNLAPTAVEPCTAQSQPVGPLSYSTTVLALWQCLRRVRVKSNAVYVYSTEYNITTDGGPTDWSIVTGGLTLPVVADRLVTIRPTAFTGGSVNPTTGGSYNTACSLYNISNHCFRPCFQVLADRLVNNLLKWLKC